MRTITMRDPSLPHQIVLTSRTAGRRHMIEVSCNCRRRTGGPPGPARYELIAEQTLWEAEDAWQAWEAWHRDQGIEAARPSRLQAAV